jgi:hypothetical protein
MPANSPLSPRAELSGFAQADLTRLHLAVEILLRLAEDDILPVPLEAELAIFRDRIEHALLQGE